MLTSSLNLFMFVLRRITPTIVVISGHEQTRTAYQRTSSHSPRVETGVAAKVARGERAHGVARVAGAAKGVVVGEVPPRTAGHTSTLQSQAGRA
jgi:hypothetical protein